MLSKYINDCLSNCYQTLMNDKSAEKLLKDIEKESPQDLQEDFIPSIVKTIIVELMAKEIPKQEEKNYILSFLRELKQSFINLKKTYILKIELNGLNDKLYRVVEMPIDYTLADLAYMIISIFNADASHLFAFTVNKKDYPCDTIDDECEDYASDYKLSELKLHKNSKFTFCYDFGDSFNFTITVMELKTYNTYPEIDKPVLEGEGYGIWEDMHYAMELYYRDKKAFREFIKENGLMSEDFPTRLKFNLSKCNEEVYDNMDAIRNIYE